MTSMSVNVSAQPTTSGSVKTEYLPALGDHGLRVRRSVTTKTATGERSCRDDVYCSNLSASDLLTGRTADAPGSHDEHLLTLKLGHTQPWATGWSAPGWDEHAELVAIDLRQALFFVVRHVLDEAPIVDDHLDNAVFLFEMNKDLFAAVTAYTEWVS